MYQGCTRHMAAPPKCLLPLSHPSCLDDRGETLEISPLPHGLIDDEQEKQQPACTPPAQAGRQHGFSDPLGTLAAGPDGANLGNGDGKVAQRYRVQTTV